MWYIYVPWNITQILGEWNNPICKNMDGPRESHTKWTKVDRETQISYAITHKWNLILKSDTNELIYKTQIDSTYLEDKPMVTKGEMCVCGNKWGAWGQHIHTAIYKINNQQRPTV